MTEHPMSSINKAAGEGSAEPSPQHKESAQYYQTTSDATDATPSIKLRHTCWTINNWTAEELERVRSYHSTVKSVTYGCWSQEVGETGTPHLQGYTAWRNTMSLEAFKRKISPRLHYEKYMAGTAQENHNYCAGLVPKKGNKLNPTFEETGELPQQGERTDWKRAVQQIREHLPVVDVIADQPHLTPNIRALERLATLTHQPPKNRDVRVLYITGASGCGKTRAIHQAYPDAYWKPEGQWWDGYDNQEVVVLDDYYSDIPYAQLLRVLDRYTLRLPVKGGFVPAAYTTVLITSNADLNDQYPNITGAKRHAMNRRIHCVIQAHNKSATQDITDALHTQAPRDEDHTPPSLRPADDPTENPTDDEGQRT